MQIDFSTLEAALAPIEKFGQGELTFDVEGTPITLRMTRPSEDLAASRYAMEALGEEDGNDPSSAVEYVDRFRAATLAYAIVQVGSTNLRDVDYVETGEFIEGTGKPIKEPKDKVMRKLISRWSKPVLQRAFHKFSELLKQVEEKAERGIEYAPSDIDSEIERLEARIMELKAEKDEELKGEKDEFSARVRQLVDDRDTVPAPQSQQVTRDPALYAEDDDGNEVQINPTQLLPVQQQAVRRQGRIAPVTIQGVPDDIEALPPQHLGADQMLNQPLGQQPPLADSSFFDADDGDNLNAILDAEHQRLLARRRAAAQGQQVPSSSALSAVGLHSGSPRPPHLDAAAAAQQAAHVPLVTPAHKKPVGQIDGKDVYRLPGQELGTPVPRPDASVINRTPTQGGSRNPRFRPPQKP